MRQQLDAVNMLLDGADLDTQDLSHCVPDDGRSLPRVHKFAISSRNFAQVPSATKPNSLSTMTYKGELISTALPATTTSGSLVGPVKDKFIGKLKPGHKPARGRRRRKQLMMMSADEIEAENEQRLEKNRQSARDCRLRKKSYIHTLEDKIQDIEDFSTDQKSVITQLRCDLQQLRAEIQFYRSQTNLVYSPPTAMLDHHDAASFKPET